MCVQVIVVSAPTMKVKLKDVGVEAQLSGPNKEVTYCWCVLRSTCCTEEPVCKVLNKFAFKSTPAVFGPQGPLFARKVIAWYYITLSEQHAT